MAKRTVTDCDLCGAKAAGTQEFCLVVGAFTDAAGAANTDQRCFDLCTRCSAALLRAYLDKLSNQEARRVVERITKAPFRDHQGRLVAVETERE